MIRRFFLPLLALAGIVFAVRSAYESRANLAGVAAPLPGAAPASAAFAHRVSGAGIVEAASENIAIGVPSPGLVLEVRVKAGDTVREGDVLLRMDDRPATAALAAAEAQVALARAQLDELERQPRPEQVRQAEERLAQAKAARVDAEAQARRSEDLFAKGVAAEEERVQRASRRDAAVAQEREAEAALAELKAGAWEPARAVARARVTAADAEATRLRVEADRLRVAAPIAGTVLRVDVQAGEYLTPGAASPMVLGDVRTLHVRVDVDEQDAHRVRDGATAVAVPRGDPSRRIRLAYVRTEPLVVPKRNLTGDNLERVDTRVLQVVYRLDEASTLRVGQQVDVQIDAPEER